MGSSGANVERTTFSRLFLSNCVEGSKSQFRAVLVNIIKSQYQHNISVKVLRLYPQAHFLFLFHQFREGLPSQLTLHRQFSNSVPPPTTESSILLPPPRQGEELNLYSARF